MALPDRVEESASVSLQIRRATLADCRAVAELALLAGDGIPGYFWRQVQLPGQELEDVGALRAANPNSNFSHVNAHLACVNDRVAGMLLAYRLEEEADSCLDDYPKFIRPMVELERCVPGSFYINMLATYPACQNMGIGSQLMAMVDELATAAGCHKSSLVVFDENIGALRLYQRLGYREVASRDVVEHSSHPHRGKSLLLAREVASL